MINTICTELLSRCCYISTLCTNLYILNIRYMKYLEFGLSWYGEYAIIWVEKKKKKVMKIRGDRSVKLGLVIKLLLSLIPLIGTLPHADLRISQNCLHRKHIHGKKQSVYMSDTVACVSQCLYGVWHFIYLFCFGHGRLQHRYEKNLGKREE